MKIIDSLKNTLIVSCQALDGEPLCSPIIMGKIAKSAEMGGASAIRANGYDDIREIKKVVTIPVIGLIKIVYKGYEPYITPTMLEVDRVVDAGADIIAIDATKRLKPDGITTEKFFEDIKRKYPHIPVMADISTYEEGIKAGELGFNIISTTLSGYTSYSLKSAEPDFDLIGQLSAKTKAPVVAEGRIRSAEHIARALRMGAYAIVVGGAITRPHEITRHYIEAINNEICKMAIS